MKKTTMAVALTAVLALGVTSVAFANEAPATATKHTKAAHNKKKSDNPAKRKSNESISNESAAQ